MSFDTVDWALTQTGLQPAEKLVLACLAWFRSADTGQCFPAQKKLAAACGFSVSSVNRHLRTLEQKGLISRRRRFNKANGAARSTDYGFPRCPQTRKGSPDR